MQDVLINIYMCNFRSLGPAVAETMTPEYSGDSWKPFVACRENTESTVSECLLELEKDCIASKHLATKVVRLTLDSYARVLEHLPNLRLVHLFRDPRAVINSRQTTTWYHLHNEKSTVQDARELCNRMLYDIEYSANLTETFPDRFLTVMFEDLRENLPEKSKILYQYFGLSTEGLEDKLASMAPIKQNEKTIMAEDGDYSGWWRKRLPYSTVELIQDACADAMDVLGYRHFSSESEQLNFDISAFKFSSKLTLQM
ncbi:carbohydrate sulfotransferase 4-like [Mya arenaria]|uniref:carbohydrate sulfotransferase 4-like n=1 Tax=Mya arenaria TaxID=6604 RepID=UPI0022E926A7|nr:carbohydrate sulfotransferase 4-like [Mya arenaria]